MGFLTGNLKKKKQITGLPYGKYNHYFNGTSEYVSIDNSDVSGNPYDFDVTNNFTIAMSLTPQNADNSSYPFYMQKGGVSGSPMWALYYESSRSVLNFYCTDGTREQFIGNVIGVTGGTNYIVICTFLNDGTGHLVLKIKTYDTNGTILANQTVSPINNLTTIKSTTKVFFAAKNGGVFHKGYFGQPCIFNTNLTGAQCDELALNIVNKNVNSHSLYASNCVGYWKQFAGKLINMVNRTYDGTYNGFSIP